MRRAQWPSGAILGAEVARRTIAVAGPGAVQILAPEQKLDGVIAGGDIRLDAASLLQLLGEQLLGDLARVDLLAAHGERDIGDDVGDIELVLGGIGAVGRGDVIDQAFVERPGIHFALPIIDDGIAEAIGLGLHVGNARGDPGGAGGDQILLRRPRQELIDRKPHRPGRGERIRVASLRDVRVGLEHVLDAWLGDGRR